MYYDDFKEIYRRDKHIIDRFFPKDVIKRLLGEKAEEEMTRGDAWEPPLDEDECPF
jgi:hypothetical protein